MRRGPAFAAALLVLALAGSATARASGQGVTIRKVDVSRLPRVSAVVSVQGSGTLAPSAFSMTENGHVVQGLTVAPLSATGTAVDVVLVLDTSDSMRGAPLEAALAAARTFVSSLPSSVRVGVMTFAGHPTVRQPLSSDHAAALAALTTPATTRGTAIYDAVTAATAMFTGTAQRNIVLLSDGSDTSSTSDMAAAVASAKSGGVAVFAVGLTGRGADESALQKLAGESGGRYAPVDAADLGSIYQGLATELSHQFELTYRSALAAGSQVTLRVSARGSSDTALVLLRSSGAAVPAVEPSKPAGQPLLHGALGEAVVLALGFLAILMLAWLLFGAQARLRRDRELARRMAAPAEADADRPDREGVAAWLPEPLIGAGERIAQAGGFSGPLDGRLERAGLPLKAGEFVAGTAAAAAAGGFVGLWLLGNVIFAVLLAALAGLVPWVAVNVSAGRRAEKLHAQLADVLMIMASSLRAGHSFLQALDMVAKEIGDPGASEFSRVVAEIRLGRPVEEALNAMAERIGSEDLTWAVMAINIQREVGGNLAEILDTLANVIRERNTIRRQIRVLSAEGRLSVWILAILPVAIGLYMAKVNPDYIKLLFTTQIGLVMVVVAVSLMILGVLWMRKLVRIRV